jgi:hypothetical protein
MTDDKVSHHLQEQRREDDRNEELDESPVPDPEAGSSSAGDDPEAD